MAELDKKSIVIFSGSQRRQSFNCRLASYLAEILAHDFSVDVIAAEDVDLPLFNQDMEQDEHILKKVSAVYKRFYQANGVIIVSPEYNGSYSPYLKNTLDWVSRLPRIWAEQGVSNPFYHKPLLLASATSGGSGGLLGLHNARNLFSYLGSLILAEQLSLPYAGTAWNEQGKIIDSYFNDSVGLTLDQFGKLIHSMTQIQACPAF